MSYNDDDVREAGSDLEEVLAEEDTEESEDEADGHGAEETTEEGYE